MPDLTLVIACYEMPAQVIRTLTSVLPPYQRKISRDDVEIILVDNGSRHRLQPSVIPSGITYRYVPPADAAPYPGPAVNEIVWGSDSEWIGIMLDGARLLTPGVVRGAMDVLSRWRDAVVDVKGWHLGHAPQQDQLAAGEDPARDQQLLEEIGWPDNGYRLFDICAPTYSSREGFLAPTNESTGLFTSRATFRAVGGYDERFTFPGGGLANIDLWYRLVERADPVVTLLGEGTFHQAHGGASTGLTRPELSEQFGEWRAEYEELTGRTEVSAPPHDPLLVGRVGLCARRVQAAALQED